MDGLDLLSINTSLATLIRQQRERDDHRPAPILVDEILAGSGFAQVDARQQVASLKRRAAYARRVRVVPVRKAGRFEGEFI